MRPVYRRLSAYERASVYAELWRQVLSEEDWRQYLQRQVEKYDREGNWIPPAQRRYRSYTGGERVWDEVAEEKIAEALLSGAKHPTVVYADSEALEYASEEILSGNYLPPAITLWMVKSKGGAPLKLGGREQVVLAYLHEHPLSTAMDLAKGAFWGYKREDTAYQKARLTTARLVRKGVLVWALPPGKGPRFKHFLLTERGKLALAHISNQRRLPVFSIRNAS